MKKQHEHIEKLKQIISLIPHQPGIYQYFDQSGKIIYIGKAKDLKKRVSSYFTKQLPSGKLRVLVNKIDDIRFMVVDTEMDALLLENNLIKKYQPRYNVLLKDDKTFPWICIKKERFPRVFYTRNPIKDGSEYFGPYASVKMMKTLLELISKLYPLRNCNHQLTEENIRQHKFKVCLEYHIGNCKGACEGKQTVEDYEQSIQQIRHIIKGNVNTVVKEFTEIMMQYAHNMEFEKAQIIKEKLGFLSNFQSKSTVVSPNIRNVDVFSFVESEQGGFVNFLKVIDGAIVQTHTVELKNRLNETPEQLLSVAFSELRMRYQSDAKEVIVPFKPADIPENIVTFTIPKIGEKKHLLSLSERNATYFKHEKEKRKELVDPERHKKRILEKLQKDLGLSEPPVRMECFDNSNFQGDYPVSAMVHFKNAKPYKKEYRHYNIKTVIGPNDFASMEEVIHRRYKRLLDEEKPLPQLIVIDGGKGQLSSAYKIIKKLGLEKKVAIIGIAKRLEEIFKPNDPYPIYLDKTSSSLKVIQHMRDEAHRFGITHHRKRLEKGTIKTELTQIKGIGKHTATELLSTLKSIERIKKASLEELEAVVGKAKAKLVFDFFKS